MENILELLMSLCFFGIIGFGFFIILWWAKEELYNIWDKD